MLKLSEKLENINAIIEKAKNAKNTYKIKITENNKSLVINKSTLKVLNENGVKLNTTYISYRKTPLLFNTLEKVLTENSDIFYNNSEN